MRKFLSVLLALCVAASVQGQDLSQSMAQFGIDPNASFSGVRKIEAKDGTVEAMIRQAPGKSRMDMTVAGQDMTVIAREDLGLNYLLMHQMGMYREVSARDVPGGANLDFSDASAVGREAVEGVPCTKYRAKFTDAAGGRAGGYYWVSDRGILMKVDMIYQSPGQKGERMVFTMQDIDVANQDAEFFEIPADYSKMGFGPGSLPFGRNPNAEEPTLGNAVEEAATDEAKQTIVNKTRSKVREGIGKLFGRD